MARLFSARLQPQSIFHRLLLALLVVGLVTGLPLILVSLQFSKESTMRRTQQTAAQQISSIADDFQQEFSIGLRRAIKGMAASEALNGYLSANADERVVARKTLETAFLRLVADYEGLSAGYYADSEGNLIVSVADGQRETLARIAPKDPPGEPTDATRSAGGSPTNEHLARLFHNLKTTPLLLSSGNMEWFMPPREVTVEGPFVDENGRLAFLAGIATIDQDSGAFGGAVVLRARLDRFISRAKALELLDANPLWLLEPGRRIFARPDDPAVSFDPSNAMAPMAHSPQKIFMTDQGLVVAEHLSVVPGKVLMCVAHAIPESLLLKDFWPTARLFALVIAISLGVALLLALWVSRKLSEPIVQLAGAASRLAQGDLSARADLRTTGEVQVLVDSFNQMSASLEQADARRSATLQVLQQTAAYLRSEGAGEDAAPAELSRMLDDMEAEASRAGGAEANDLRAVATLIVRLFREREEYLRNIRAARDAAEQANRAKGDFLATMSHEIRTPLNAVIGLSDVLYGTKLSPEQRKLVETMEAAGRQLLQIINDVLDFSRLQAGRVEVNEETVELAPLIDRLILIIKGLPGAAQLAIDTRLDPSVPHHVVLDGQRLMQILTNLLGNAVKFTERGSVILDIRVVSHGDAGERLVCAVTDTGPGVPREMRERIFEPFKQIGEDRFTPHAGSGLGLAICRMLAQAMGGAVFLDGDVTSGARFVLELPLRRGNEAAAAAAADLKEQDGPVGLRVLVAEDTPANQLVIQLMLNRLGHTSVVVENGRDAVEAFTAQHFDVVLLDVQMPVMNGYEAARHIRRAGEHGACVPIVALTAFAQTSDREEALSHGITEFVPKPLRAADLTRVLQQLCCAPA